jgi:pimeloyl-ACP methyl ester carboxylesterase
MVGSRPDDFATLEEGMAYRAAMSPILAARSVEDQRELALGVLRRELAVNGRGRWTPPTSCSRSSAGRRSDHPYGRCCSSALPGPWGTDSDVLSEAQARRMVHVLPRGELVRVPGIGHAPTLVEPVVLAALDRFLGRLLGA